MRGFHYLIAGCLWMMLWAGLAFLFVVVVRS
jgi:hypothetical protein